ncbi:hypothetical protein TcCL_ESM04516 [Trypanosoma cruzi]|nr:hypothetical protein TcCL_ESM04516 [Trypanosoma cruzi]
MRSKFLHSTRRAANISRKKYHLCSQTETFDTSSPNGRAGDTMTRFVRCDPAIHGSSFVAAVKLPFSPSVEGHATIDRVFQRIRSVNAPTAVAKPLVAFLSTDSGLDKQTCEMRAWAVFS